MKCRITTNRLKDWLESDDILAWKVNWILDNFGIDGLGMYEYYGIMKANGIQSSFDVKKALIELDYMSWNL